MTCCDFLGLVVKPFYGNSEFQIAWPVWTRSPSSVSPFGKCLHFRWIITTYFPENIHTEPANHRLEIPTWHEQNKPTACHLPTQNISWPFIDNPMGHVPEIKGLSMLRWSPVPPCKTQKVWPCLLAFVLYSSMTSKFTLFPGGWMRNVATTQRKPYFGQDSHRASCYLCWFLGLNTSVSGTAGENVLKDFEVLHWTTIIYKMLLVSYPTVFVLSVIEKSLKCFFFQKNTEGLHCSCNNDTTTTTTTTTTSTTTTTTNNNNNNNQWRQVCPPSAGMKQFHQDQMFLPQWRLAIAWVLEGWTCLDLVFYFLRNAKLHIYPPGN